MKFTRYYSNPFHQFSIYSNPFCLLLQNHFLVSISTLPFHLFLQNPFHGSISKPQISKSFLSSLTSPTVQTHTPNAVEHLLAFFSKHPSLRNPAELQDLPLNLTHETVEVVLKSLKHWKPAYEFFYWVSELEGFKHTCYTYNALATILSRANQRNQIRILAKNMVNSRVAMTPGALGFLIRCFGTQGLVEEANYVFDNAKLLSCVPNNYTYNCLLEALAKSGRVDLVESRLREMIDSGRDADKYTLTPVLQAYCNSGKFEKALSVFNRIYDNNWVDEHIFTILVVSFSKWGEVDKALELISRMEDLNIKLKEKTLYVLIHGFTREKRVDAAVILFSRMKELGISKDISLYSVLINGLCERKEFEKALKFYMEMKESGIFPDVGIFMKLISYFCQEGDWDTVNRLTEENEDNLDLADLVSVYNTILEGLVHNSEVGKAHWLIQAMMDSKKFQNDQVEVTECDSNCAEAVADSFLRIKKAVIPNSVSFNIVIYGLCKTRKLDLALDLVNSMVEMGCTGNTLIYNNLILELCNNDRLEESYELMVKMKEFGFEATHFTFNAIFGCLCRRENVSSALNLIKEMRKHGHEPWIKHYTSLVKQLCTHGKVSEACNFLNDMIQVGFLPNVIAYSAAINGLCKVGELDQALKLFRKISDQCLPDVVAHNIIICGFCKGGRVPEAQDIFIEMLGKGLVPSVVTYNLMIDGWCKSGRIDEALLCFSKVEDEGRTPTMITYTILIDGLCNNRRPDEALSIWNKMKENGCVPNRIAYIALVNGLCKCERLDEALLYFRELENEGHESGSFVYMALINGFLSLENLLMAFKLLREMVQKAKSLTAADKYYPLLLRALMKMYGDEKTGMDIKNLIEEGCIPLIQSVVDLELEIKKLQN